MGAPPVNGDTSKAQAQAQPPKAQKQAPPNDFAKKYKELLALHVALDKQFKTATAELEQAKEAANKNIELAERVQSLQETNEALNIHLDAVQAEHETLTLRLDNQASALAAKLKTHLGSSTSRYIDLNDSIKSVSGIIIGGQKPEENFYELLNRNLLTAKEEQEQTTSEIQKLASFFYDEVKLRNELCDSNNSLLTQIHINSRNLIYLSDLAGVPEEIRKLRTELDEIMDKIKKLLSTDFSQSTKETIEKVAKSFKKQLLKLEVAKKSFTSLNQSQKFIDLFQRINYIANSIFGTLENYNLHQYAFYTTEGQESTIARLNLYHKTEHERYTTLRDLLTNQWNSIVQLVSELECESNLLDLTLRLYVPLWDHSTEINTFEDNMRKFRLETKYVTGDNKFSDELLKDLQSKLTLAKGRFFDALRNKVELEKLVASENQPRSNADSKKTLSDLIKDEETRTNQSEELSHSMKNNVAPEAAVDLKLTTMHKNLQEKYENFSKKIDNLNTVTYDKGLLAATEIELLERAIENRAFTGKTIYNLTKAAKSWTGMFEVSLYQHYWANPSEGIEIMKASSDEKPVAQLQEA